MNLLTQNGSLFIQKVGSSVQKFISATLPETEPSLESRGQPTGTPQPSASDSVGSGSRRMPSNAQVKTRILDDIVAGSGKFDPIKIEDDEDVYEVSPPPSKKLRTSAGPGAALSDVSQSPLLRSHALRASSEERRLLGHPESASPPARRPSINAADQRRPHSPGAVRIEIPTSSSEMSYKQRNRNLTAAPTVYGLLKPMNTLHTPKSTKQEYYESKTRGLTLHGTKETLKPTTGTSPQSHPQTSSKASSQTSPLRSESRGPDQSHNLSQPPRKKPRLGNSPTGSIHPDHSDKSSRDRLYNLDGLPHTDLNSLAFKYGRGEATDKIGPTSTVATKRTPLRDIGLRPASRDLGTDVGRVMDSPDKSLDGSEPERGAQTPRQQRIDGGNLESYAERTKSASSNAKKASPHQLDERGRTRMQRNGVGPSIPPPTATPPKQKITPGYEAQSPDELNIVDAAPSATDTPPVLGSSSSTGARGETFNLRAFICEGFPSVAGQYAVEVFKHNKTFTINYRNRDLGLHALTEPIRLAKIIRLYLPAHELNIVYMQLSRGSFSDDRCFMVFPSRDILAAFFHLVYDINSTMAVTYKDDAWLNNALGRAHAVIMAKAMDSDEESTMHRLPRKATHEGAQSVLPGKQQAHRQRLVDQLDAPKGSNAEGHKAGGPMSETDAPQEANRKSNPLVEYANALAQSRQTRSRAVHRDAVERASPLRSIRVEPRRQDPPWTKPLTFPREGPQRETVTWDDLHRLEDDEFLNDSLVAFYIRYLQEQCKENSKRMHVFSTFFYEKLTQTVGSKGGTRQINYEGVASWTKKLNLFKRDYVVVPVNENAHWYVMIICNLRALVEAPVLPEENESVVDAQLPLPNATADDDPRDILKSDVVTSYPATDDANGEDIETGLPNGLERRRYGRRKQKERNLRKYDMHEPVIITLDSLDLNRSPTARVLKDYLVREAKEKYNIDIVKEQIGGMTAKRIPLQGNFSDCGLYLCMYLEQFLANPEAFTRSILQRDNEALKWPKKVTSTALRQRFYDMLTELYAEQQGNGRAKVPNVGRILIRDEDFLTPKELQTRSMHDALDFVDDYLTTPEEQKVGEQHKSADRTQLERVMLPNTSNKADGSAKNGLHEAARTMNTQSEAVDDPDPIVIEDDLQPQLERRDGLTSRYFASKSKLPDEADAQPANNPRALANRVRYERSPQRQTQPASSAVNIVTPRQEAPLRQDRSVSVSTDFLTGHESYSCHLPPEDGGEVPVGRTETRVVDKWLGFVDDSEQHQQEAGHQTPISNVPESIRREVARATHDGEMLLD